MNREIQEKVFDKNQEMTNKIKIFILSNKAWIPMIEGSVNGRKWCNAQRTGAESN